MCRCLRKYSVASLEHSQYHHLTLKKQNIPHTTSSCCWGIVNDSHQLEGLMSFWCHLHQLSLENRISGNSILSCFKWGTFTWHWTCIMVCFFMFTGFFIVLTMYSLRLLAITRLIKGKCFIFLYTRESIPDSFVHICISHIMGSTGFILSHYLFYDVVPNDRSD